MKTFIKPLNALILALTCVAGRSGPASAATIAPLSQTRCVRADAMFQGPTNAAACAPDFGAFNQSVHLGFASRFEPWSLDAAQQSQIGATSINASGWVGLAFANAFVSGSASNEFRVAFRLTQPVNFTLAGSLVWDGMFGPFGSVSPVVRLTGPSGVAYETAPALNDATPLDYNTTGSLPVGQYLIEAYAGSGSDFAGGETMNFSLDLQVTPTGPVVPGDSVYQLTGLLLGEEQNGTGLSTRYFSPANLVNLALGQPPGSATTGRVLGLVIDCTANSPSRLVVWDKRASNVVAEVGSVQFAVALGSGSNYTAVADLKLSDGGSIIGSVNSVNSKAATLVRGVATPASRACVNSVTLTSSLGQMFLREGGGTNTVIIRSGAFTTLTKLGNLP